MMHRLRAPARLRTSGWLVIGLGMLLGLLLIGSWIRTAKTPPDQAKPALKQSLPAFPGSHELNQFRFIALYGMPGEPILGLLGQYSIKAALSQVQSLARQYRPLSPQPIYPTLEIIATLATAEPGPNGHHSRPLPVKQLRPWIEAAQLAGVYVILDLQPGRQDFLAAAKQHQALLNYSNVGLAVDPEWRVGPHQVPLVDKGLVRAAEINKLTAWLSNFTKKRSLPPKLFLMHQFRLSMLPDRQKINLGHDNLRYMLQMDGQGSQPLKRQTYHAITANLNPLVAPGWKNFSKYDQPMLNPSQTLRQKPSPWFISYQ